MPDLHEVHPWLPTLESALGAEVSGVTPLAGGACQDNFRIDAVRNGEPVRYALRSDAASSLPGSLDRHHEAQAIRAAVAAGVPTPAVRHELPDLLREGATATLLDWAEGVAIAAKVLKDPRLAPAREALPDQLATGLASIHAVRPEDAPDFRPGTGWSSVDHPVQAALDFCRSNLDQLPQAMPSLELVLRWLSDHRPDEGPAHLVHGDFRMGNFLVGPGGLSAVLDWEFAHWGRPAEDLGWFFVRDWRFGRDHLPAGGLATREAFLAAYERAGGPAVDRDEVLWWEVMGNLRWAAGAAHQTERVRSGAEDDLELFVIGRRVPEMAFEALRLIEQADPGPGSQPLAPRSLPPTDDVGLLGAVASFLMSDVLPAIDDRAIGFRVRVAAHMLGGVARGAVMGASIDRAELEALGTHAPVDSAELPDALAKARAIAAAAIRHGHADADLRHALLPIEGARARVGQPRFDTSMDPESPR